MKAILLINTLAISGSLLMPYPTFASEGAQNTDRTDPKTETTSQRVGPQIWSPPTGVDSFEGPLADQGRWLEDHGVRPQIAFNQFYLANPSVGLRTGRHEAVTLLAVGTELDLQRLFGLPGGRLHAEELFVPFRNNIEYGAQVGDVLAGNPGPYIPKVNHLTLLTYEQRLFQDRLTIEAGKSNAGNYFGQPLCNVPLACVNAILQDNAGFNPPPYSNWGLRVSYDFNPALRLQAGSWRSNNAFPFTNGWERRAGDSGGALSTLYAANLVYRTDYTSDRYPQTWELMAFYNNRLQTDPYYTIQGTAQLDDPLAQARTRDGLFGYHLGGRKTFWRADGGQSDTPTPTTLTGFGTLTHNIGQEAYNGVASQANAGIILSAPFASRPLDSYSLNATWAQLTQSEQQLLERAYAIRGGEGQYGPGRESFALGVDGNFVLGRGVAVSGSLAHVWNPSSFKDPYSGIQPKNGFTFMLALHFQIDQWLGLNHQR